MEIVGLLGYIGSGKGTVADRLVKNHGYHKINFADTLKDVTSIIFGWDRALLEGDTKESRAFRDKVDAYWSKKYNREITPRKVLQDLGTEVFRETFDANIWINCLEKKILDCGHDKIVVSDTRFPNECEFIKNMSGGVLMSVWSNDLPEFHEKLLETRGMTTEDYNSYMKYHLGYVPHASETAWVLPYGDTTAKIGNFGSLDDLYTTVDSVSSLIQFNLENS